MVAVQTRGPTSIKNLTPALMERGKIKIGEKGQMMRSKAGNDFQPPKKLDHFRITTMERGPDGNFITDKALHELYGPNPKELPVRLLYDTTELNFPTRYSCYRGQQQWCTGDGESAMRIDQANKKVPVACPCERIAPDYQGKDKCKVNGCLSCIIDGAETIGGAWKFRTTSYNSVVGILSSLSMIKMITGGPLSGIPLYLMLAPKTVVSPADGRVQTIHVVGLEFKGKIEGLRQIGYDLAMDRQKHLIRMEDIEKDARKLLTMADPIEDDETVAEFYPDQMMASAEVIEQPAGLTLEEQFDALEPEGSDRAKWDEYAALVAKEWEMGIPEMKANIINGGSESCNGYLQAFSGWLKAEPEKAQVVEAEQQQESPPEEKKPDPPAPVEEAKPETQATKETAGVLPQNAGALWDLIGLMRKERFTKWEENYRSELVTIPAGDPRRDTMDKKWKNTFGTTWTAEGQPGYIAPAAPLQPEEPPVVEEKAPDPPPPPPAKKDPPPLVTEERKETPPPPEVKAPPKEGSLICSTRGNRPIPIKVCRACLLKDECKDYATWMNKA